MTDSQEESVDFNVLFTFFRFSFPIHQTCSFESHIRTVKFERIVFEKHLDVFSIEYPLLHSFRSSQIVFADNQIYFPAQTRQISCLLASSITTTDDSHIFTPVKESVTSSTGTHSQTSEFLFGRKPQVFSRSSRSDDHCISLDLLAIVDRQFMRMPGKIDGSNDTETDIRPETFCLFTHIFHHNRTRHSFRITGKILDFGSCRQLSTHL